MPRPQVTARGTFALVLAPLSAVAGLLLGAEELILLTVALGSFLVIGRVQCAARGRRARGRWRVTVQLPAQEVPTGRALHLAVGLTPHAGGRGVGGPVLLEDPQPSWRPAGPGGPQRAGRITPPRPPLLVRLPRLAPGEAATVHFGVPTGHRGVFHLGGVRLWCTDGVGLFAQLVAVGPSATVTVHPVPVVVALSDGLLLGDHGPEAHHPVDPDVPRRPDSLGDFAGLRPYIPGDRLRLLYWPSLARTGDLLVRDFDDVAPRRVHLVADVRPQLGEHGTETVLATAAGLGLRALALGATVEFSTTIGGRTAIGPGPHGGPALLRAIAAVPNTTHPARRRAFPARPSRSPRSPQRPPGTTPVPAIFSGSALVVTTPGGARSLPPGLGAGQLVIAS